MDDFKQFIEAHNMNTLIYEVIPQGFASHFGMRISRLVRHQQENVAAKLSCFFHFAHQAGISFLAI